LLLAKFKRLKARDAPPEIDIGLLPEEVALANLKARKLALKFFKVFAISAKVTDFAK
jgi:hypothetical protein